MSKSSEDRRRKLESRGPAARAAKRFYRLWNPCVYCGDPAESIDHIIPLSKGGLDRISNWAPSCNWCNHLKADTYQGEKS